MVMNLSSSILFFYSVFVALFLLSHAQQTYVNNYQLDCYNNVSSTYGFRCNGVQRSCKSYLTFRSLPPYDTPVSIGYLLDKGNSQIAQEIAKINNISDIDKIPTNTMIIVPVNCTCSGNYYQHNTSYTLKYDYETYFSLANDTYHGLSTCQALINQNPYDSRNLYVGLELVVPLRCACPTKNQTASGARFLLTFLVTWGDDISQIGDMFGVDVQSILDANELLEDTTIYPFTPILVPLKTEPTIIKTAPTPPSDPPKTSSPVPVEESKSSRKWVFVGIGIGVGFILLALSGCLVWFLCRRTQRSKNPIPEGKKLPPSSEYATIPEKISSGFVSVSSEGAWNVLESLTVYTFGELQRATGFFSEDHRIKGSVYRAAIKGDNAAIKRMKGNVSNEINILKQINHSNVIRLSGFCVHDGNTYLVYEFAEKGSLSDWIHEKKYLTSSSIGWKQRVQIAYDVADGLNYLHNYANPPFIHKDLKSSNILLDGNFRAKISNFGLARTFENEEGLQLTRHVVGTQGYMAPEYLENGAVTPKMDVFAFGVVILELLSGREAATSSDDENKGEFLLSASIKQVLEGENVREKLRGFMDPALGNEYPLDLAFSTAQLAVNCVAHDLNSRPAMSEVFLSLSKILSSSVDWDPSDNIEHSRSLSLGR